MVYVLENGLSLFTGNINGYGDTAMFSTTLTLANGALVDFAVGLGSHYDDDSTGIDATLTHSARAGAWKHHIARHRIAQFAGVGPRFCVEFEPGREGVRRFAQQGGSPNFGALSFTMNCMK